MRPFSAVAVCLLVVLFQAAAAPSYAFAGLTPDFVLLAAAFAALHGSRPAALLVALASGLLRDAVSLDPWGANAASSLTLALIVSQGAARSRSARLLPLGFCLALGILAALTVRWTGLRLLEGGAPRFSRELLSGLLSFLLAAPFFAVLEGLRPLFLDASRAREGRRGF
jgi:rod shape-determining protein MreD